MKKKNISNEDFIMESKNILEYYFAEFDFDQILPEAAFEDICDKLKIELKDKNYFMKLFNPIFEDFYDKAN
jgi:hypothetical protein